MADGEDTNKLVEAGSKITGAAIGGTVGSLLGLSVAGPVGAISGAVVGNFISACMEISTDFLYRKLSKKEKIRVGAALNYTVYKIDELISKGEKLRKDGFFESKIDEKSQAEEIFEGILIKSQFQYQEKKIRFISNIFANAAFREDVSIEEVHHILRIVDELTYRELCILALIDQKNNCDNTLSHKPEQIKIGLIFPSDYAIIKEENFIAENLNNFSIIQGSGIKDLKIKTETKRYLLPLPHKNVNFYYLHKEFLRLKSYDLIGDFFHNFRVEKSKILREKPQLDFQENEYSVYTFNRGFWSDKYSAIMSLEDIEYADLEDLKQYIEPYVLLNSEAAYPNPLSHIVKPNYLVTYIPPTEPVKLP